MKSYLISLLILLNCFPSQAMLVRVVQPVAKRVVARLFTPRVAPQKVMRTLQLPIRTVPKPILRSSQFKARPYYRPFYTKPTWLLPASVGSLYASTLRSRAYAEPIVINQTKPWAPVEQQYRERFKKTEETYMQELFALCNITEQEWQEYVKKAEAYLVNNNEWRIENNISLASISPTMHTKIREILRQHLPERNIHILHDNRIYTMSASSNIVSVNSEKCSTLTDKEIEGIVAHEIQHIINNDHVRSIALWDLCINKRIPTKQRNVMLNKMSRLQEHRADILGGLSTTLETTQIRTHYRCNQKQFKLSRINVEDEENHNDDTHPRDYTRCTYLDKLYQEMLESSKRVNVAAQYPTFQYPTLHTP